MDELRLERQQASDRRDSQRGGGLPAGGKVEVADTDLQISHERRIALAETPGQTQPIPLPPSRPTISTHVLDTERGMPAEGVRVDLFRLDVGAAPIRMTQALTDSDGRVRDLLERPLTAGEYRLEFDFERDEDAVLPAPRRRRVDHGHRTRSYHVPLLLAPYSMTTYRGS